jgi:hypothetical protein
LFKDFFADAGGGSPLVMLAGVLTTFAVFKLIELVIEEVRKILTDRQTRYISCEERVHELELKIVTLESDIDGWKTKYYEKCEEMLKLLKVKESEKGATE